MAPYFGDLAGVQPELFFVVHQVEALGVRFHQAILDTVVHHLHEVPRAAGPHVSPALIGGRGQRLEDRAEPTHGLCIAADRHAVALFDPPDAAAGATSTACSPLSPSQAARRTVSL